MSHSKATSKAATAWLRGQAWCASVPGLMTSCGCSAGWLTCTKSIAKHRHASSTYARRQVSACRQDMYSPRLGFRPGRIDILSSHAAVRGSTVQVYEDGAVPRHSWYGQGRLQTIQSTTRGLYLQFACKSTPLTLLAPVSCAPSTSGATRSMPDTQVRLPSWYSRQGFR